MDYPLEVHTHLKEASKLAIECFVIEREGSLRTLACVWKIMRDEFAVAWLNQCAPGFRGET